MAVVPLVGIVLPLGFYLARRLSVGSAPASLFLAAVFSLGGGLLLRYAILHAPQQILADRPSLISNVPPEAFGTPGSGAPWLSAISPEDGRQPSESGADPGNRPAVLHPRSKFFDHE